MLSILVLAVAITLATISMSGTFSDEFKHYFDDTYWDENLQPLSVEFGNIQVTDAINMRFLAGLFPGAAKHFQVNERPLYGEISLARYLSRYNDFVEFCELGYPARLGQHKLVFIFDNDVSDFQWVLMDHAPGFDQYGISRNINFVVEPFFGIETLEASQPFVTSWTWRGHEPARGISFVDNNNNTRVFTFNTCFCGECPGWSIDEFLEF